MVRAVRQDKNEKRLSFYRFCCTLVNNRLKLLLFW